MISSAPQVTRHASLSSGSASSATRWFFQRQSSSSVEASNAAPTQHGGAQLRALDCRAPTTPHVAFIKEPRTAPNEQARVGEVERRVLQVVLGRRGRG